MKSLKGYFLIASPNLTESTFCQTVVLILQHDENGALGVVVNRQMEVTVQQACSQALETECEVEGNLHEGGPCDKLLMVLHSSEDVDPDDDEAVLPGLHFSTDQQTIERLLHDPPNELKFIVGYSGWAAGQLEGELKSGSWLISQATMERVFGPIESLWHRLINEASLSQWVDPKLIPDDPSLN